MRYPGSFRDPDGFLFTHEQVLYRCVKESYRPSYRKMMDEGLYDSLIAEGDLVAHEEVEWPEGEDDGADAWRVLRPERIPYVTYPYEWSFSQLRSAALLTLRVQMKAIEHGMTLKDASAYNVQFRGVTPLFVDTLSFEPLDDSGLWRAYRQFCQHFLAPLSLMAYGGHEFIYLLRHYLDGIPLAFASKNLPYRSWLKPGLLFHLHMHAWSQRRHQANELARVTAEGGDRGGGNISALVENLRQTVRSLRMKEMETEWKDYYQWTNYSRTAFSDKAELVASYLRRTDAVRVLDLGANTGEFSRVARSVGAEVLAADIDCGAVESHFLRLRKLKRENDPLAFGIQPVVLDLSNPTGPNGWDSREREGFADRFKADAVLALALLHHLAIGNNTPLSMIARMVSRLGAWLIIEFVPKTDSQVKRLLQVRDDIFTDYSVDGFEEAFQEYFDVVERNSIRNSERILYLMKRRGK